MVPARDQLTISRRDVPLRNCGSHSIGPVAVTGQARARGPWQVERDAMRSCFGGGRCDYDLVVTTSSSSWLASPSTYMPDRRPNGLFHGTNP